jgi:hypothetical protein
MALTPDCKQLTLALAVNIDFDYFSRHSSGCVWSLLLLFVPTVLMRRCCRHGGMMHFGSWGE